MTKKFWLLLNHPASHGPFRPKLQMPIGTIFVEIFKKEKILGYLKKNGVLKFFGKPVCPSIHEVRELAHNALKYKYFCSKIQ